MRGDVRRHGRTFAAATVAVLALGVLVRAVGVEAVHAALAGVLPSQLAILLAVGFLPLVVWGGSLRLALLGIDVPVGALRAVELFVAAGFLNNVTPLGQLGGDPPSGLLVAGDRGTSFERGLAAITAVNAANRMAVVALGVAGLAWVGGTGAGWSVAWSVAAWAVLFGVVAAAWLRRDAVVARVAQPLAALAVGVGALLPLVEAPAASSVETRVRGFVAALERLAAEPRRLALVLLLGGLGHLAVAATLWLSLRAAGGVPSVPATLAVVALAKLGGLSPTPGGAGSATVLLAGLLVALAGVDAATATAGALLYRAAAFWVPTAVGGVVAVRLVAGMAAE